MLKLELITPEKVALTEEVYEVILPADAGQIAVLPGHTALVTLIKPGVISVRREKGDHDNKLEHLATSGGLAEITGKSVKILADSADRAEDLDELKIQQARDEAKRQAKAATDEVSYIDAVSRLETELARLKVKNLKKRHGSRTGSPENIQ